MQGGITVTNEFKNRLAGLLQDGQSTDAAQTADREDASRTGGGEAGGAAPPRGTGRQRGQAVRDQLARLMPPLDDPDVWDRMARNVERALVDELRPAGFIERAAVSLL